MTDRPDPLPPRETRAHRLKVMTSTPGVSVAERGPDLLWVKAEDEASLARWVRRLFHAIKVLQLPDTIDVTWAKEGSWGCSVTITDAST